MPIQRVWCDMKQEIILEFHSMCNCNIYRYSILEEWAKTQTLHNKIIIKRVHRDTFHWFMTRNWGKTQRNRKKLLGNF